MDDIKNVIDPKSFDQSQFSRQDFELAAKDDLRFDKKFKTKPIGYFKDALIRFRKNKSSVVAAVFLFLLILMAIFGPLMSPYITNETHTYYSHALPKISLFQGSGFWDGTTNKSNQDFSQYVYDLSHGAIVNGTVNVSLNDAKEQVYAYRVDTYVVGYEYKDFQTAIDPLFDGDKAEFERILDYEKATGIRILYPLVDRNYYSSYNNYTNVDVAHDKGNYFYKLKDSHGTKPLLDANNNIIPAYYKLESRDPHLYITDSDGYVIAKYNGSYDPITGLYGSGNYECRVDYDQYYIFSSKEGRTPMFIFGSDHLGRDIFTRLWHGARLSLILGFSVAIINIILGIIYGAIEGYYGGTTDLIMERITDILVEIPSLILLTLFQIYFANTLGPVPALLFAFIVTGWIGTAGTVRMQFYRFKRQEYVLAARTLGAKDGRLIFRHILPNAIGTLITSCVLMIPGVIFSESTLSFLNIVDLSSSTMTSVGTMLSDAQGFLYTYPHELLFPALFISILMISFNLFGNGLRDAFNPSLRGVEE